jgi:hypothetical protein
MSAEATAKPVSRVRLWWPVIVCLLMIAWSNIPPYRAHIRKEDRALMVWHWRLYEQGGWNYCDVRYFDMNQGGEPIKRWELYGYDRPGAMPDNLLRIKIKGLSQDYNRVCSAMRKAGDPNPNVEVYSRCGVKKGWKEYEQRKRNVCAPKGKGKKRKTEATQPQQKQP